MAKLFSLQRGDAPLLISIPHLGTDIPAQMQHRYSDVALTRVDADWHLDRVYAFAAELGATILGARVSRYVIDANRPPDGSSLYPGQTTTSLCPTETFRGEPLYRDGAGPDAHEVARRVQAYYRPYHEALETELRRLRAMHPNVLLWEAHSIASVLPRLFEGKLPDLNIGTLDGRTSAPDVQAPVVAAAAASEFTWVANGRFKGGYITRHFGAPEKGVHVVQLEMCQSLYMNESSPYEFIPGRAAKLEPVLRKMVAGAFDAVCALNTLQ